MPDITMCSGIGCENKETCYRAMATSEYYQAYFVTPPLKEKAETGAARCEYYWPIKEEKQSQQLNNK